MSFEVMKFMRLFEDGQLSLTNLALYAALLLLLTHPLSPATLVITALAVLNYADRRHTRSVEVREARRRDWVTARAAKAPAPEVQLSELADEIAKMKLALKLRGIHTGGPSK